MLYGRPQPDIPEEPVRMMNREDRRALLHMLLITAAICLVIAIAGGLIR